MATKIEFKQQCPSCEAQVPIKDRRLIGRKIDCPKCKYRFVVEDPEVEDEAPGKGKKGKATAAKGRARPGAEDAAGRPRKKPEGGKSTLYVGLGLGAAALILLGVVGYLLFGPSGDRSKKGPGGPGPGPGPGQVQENGPKPEPPPKPPIANPTNLLPNNTEGVMSVNVNRLLDSPLGRVVFETPGGFSREAFARQFGFSTDEVKRLVLASNDAEGWEFSVISTARPVKLDDLSKRMGLKSGKTIEGLEYHLVTGELDSLSRWLFNNRAKPLALHQVDDQTLVLAHVPPMEKFLEVKGKPKPLTQPPAGGAGQPQPGGPEKQPGQPGGAGASLVQPGGAVEANPGQPVGVGGQPIQPGGGQPKPPAPAATGSYLTINQGLKTLLDGLEQGQEPVILSMVRPAGPGHALLRQMALPFVGTLLATPPQQLKEMQAQGLAVEAMKADKLIATVAFEYKTDESAKNAEKQRRGDTTTGVKLLQDTLGMPVVVLDEQGNLPVGMEPPADGKLSKIGITRKERTISFRFDFMPGHELLDQMVQRFQPPVIEYKGRMDMAGSRPRLHELAAALRRYVEKNNQFPRGTINRKPARERAGLPWRPDLRLSWMVELLPHLGRGEYQTLHDAIDRDKGWRDPENHLAAFALVPHFLAAGATDKTWWVSYPGLNGLAAATHYVGIAGAGLDAADSDFPTLDSDWEKKIGVFGYDREPTRLEDIKDGPANTIVLIQVPPLYKTPWLAGGGSTVRGVAENDCIRPFICTEHNGKPGTFAIMADGAVRFIPEDIPDDVFKALCTIKGGEMVDNLDTIAPLVAGPPTTTELKPMVPPEKPMKPEPSSADGPKEWKEYTVKGAGIAVSLPGVPEETTEPGATYVAAKGRDQLQCLLMFAKPPSAATADPKDVLDVGKQVIVDRYKGVAGPSKATGFQNHSGVEFDLTFEGSSARCRVFKVGSYMVWLLAGPVGKARNEDIQRFFDSIRLTGTHAPQPGGKQ